MKLPKSLNLAWGGDAEPDRARALADGGQLVLELGHVPAHSEADFMVAPDNRFAFEHVLAYPAWPHPLTLIEGPAKSGKSHLAWIWAQRAGADSAPPERIAALAAAGGQGPLVLDDADRAGFDEAALFHLLTQSIRDQRPLLITARRPVADWPLRTDDVRSRLRLATRFAIAAPDDILLSQMFVKLFADRQVTVDPKIISYLVARMERSSEEVVALVALVDRLALSRRKPITKSIAAEALALRAARAEDDGEQG